MKVGVIGCGAVSHYCHIPALARVAGVTIAAVADPDEKSRSRAMRATRAPGYKSAEFLLAGTDVDAVIIATPPATHVAIAVMAVRAGKAIYLEKPIATAIADAASLSEEAQAAGVRAVVGFNRRSHPLFRRMRDLIGRDAIGTIHAVQTTFCEPAPADGMPPWKGTRTQGGGVLLDLASHHIDLIRWITRSEIAQVRASARSDISEQDSASVEMTLGDGVMAQSFYSFRSGYSERVTVFGDKGKLEVDRHAGSLVLRRSRRIGYGARRAIIAPDIRDVPWKLRRIVRPAHDPSYHAALRSFFENDASLPSLADGEESLRGVVAAEESAITGKPVVIATH